MTETLDHQPPESLDATEPGRGFADPRLNREAALVFRAAGINAEIFRSLSVSRDTRLAWLGGELDVLDAEGIDATRAMGILHADESLVPFPRTAPDDGAPEAA